MRKLFAAQLHEFLLKIGGRRARNGVARRHDAPLARIVGEKFYQAEVKRFQFIRRAIQAVLAKSLVVAQFQIRTKPVPHAF